ncbi:MAG: hypothetical protein QME78_13760, partial [Thermodesulfobacteriota bacterium]|nr:hypothetical protein [Thermodesulfobacteriota bacterium]
KDRWEGEPAWILLAGKGAPQFTRRLRRGHEKKTMFVNSGAEAVENAGIGGTFGGNPVCCRAGLAVLKIPV